MTQAQKILKKWIDKNFVDVKVEYPTADTATIIDYKGETMTVSINLYGDILEVGTNKILAVSDLPHDLLKIGYQIPKTWTEIPYQNSLKAEEK